MHLSANSGVQSVGSDEHRTGDLDLSTVTGVDDGDNAVDRVAVADDLVPGADGS